MPNAKAIFAFLIFLFALPQANAQAPGADQGGQAQPQPPTASGDASMPGVEKAQPQAAEAGSVDATSQAPAKDVKPGKQVLLPEASFDVRYSSLRRGRDQEIAVLLCRPKEYCWFEKATHKDQAVPVSLRIEPMEGFTIRYGHPRHYKSAVEGTPEYPADPRLIFLKVHADSRLNLGKYTLQGTMVFHRAGDEPSAEPQTITIQVPVTVVSHDDSVVALDWPYIHHPGRVAGEVGRDTLLIVALPVLGIAGFFMCGSFACQ